MFDFDAAIAEASSMLERKELEAIILAPSGSGKSSLMGTFGVPTLYVFSSGENHGPRAAMEGARRVGAGKIIPFCVDLVEKIDEATGERKMVRIGAQEAFERLMDVLKDGAFLKSKGIQAVAIDGAAEIEFFLRDHPEWKKLCLSANGKHSGFAEPTATVTMFRPIVNALKDLQRDHGLHYAVSCMLDVKETGVAGDITEASPRLKGFQVAEQLIQQFNDVLVVGKMTKGNESKWKLQFLTDIAKTAKEESGAQKRAMNFNPRVAGCTPPPYMDADLRQVIKLKAS